LQAKQLFIVLTFLPQFRPTSSKNFAESVVINTILGAQGKLSTAFLFSKLNSNHLKYLYLSSGDVVVAAFARSIASNSVSVLFTAKYKNCVNKVI
jgi:hypothetical protein